jgi:hypothetical protein
MAIFIVRAAPVLKSEIWCQAALDVRTTMDGTKESFRLSVAKRALLKCAFVLYSPHRCILRPQRKEVS